MERNTPKKITENRYKVVATKHEAAHKVGIEMQGGAAASLSKLLSPVAKEKGLVKKANWNGLAAFRTFLKSLKPKAPSMDWDMTNMIVARGRNGGGKDEGLELASLPSKNGPEAETTPKKRE